MLPQSVGANGRGGWGTGGGGRILQTIVVCRCCREASLAIISLDMKYDFMKGRFCWLAVLQYLSIISVKYSAEFWEARNVTFAYGKSRSGDL